MVTAEDNRFWRFPDLSSRSVNVRFGAAVALHRLAEMGANQTSARMKLWRLILPLDRKRPEQPRHG